MYELQNNFVTNRRYLSSFSQVPADRGDRQVQIVQYGIAAVMILPVRQDDGAFSSKMEGIRNSIGQLVVLRWAAL